MFKKETKSKVTEPMMAPVPKLTTPVPAAVQKPVMVPDDARSIVKEGLRFVEEFQKTTDNGARRIDALQWMKRAAAWLG